MKRESFHSRLGFLLVSAGCYLLMMYYTTVSGWMLGYFFKFVGGTFTGMSSEAVDAVFPAMLANPAEMIVWTAVTVLAGGRLWGALFFLFMFFVCFSTMIAVFENLLLPLESLVYLLFCVTKWGWGFDKYLAEANTGKGIKMPRALKPYFQFVLPVLILVILIQGLLK